MTHYLIKLDCGHGVRSEVELRLQYPDDEHYVLCPSCRKANNKPTAWNLVTSVKDLTYDKSNAHLHTMYSGLPLVLSDAILRVQPSVPLHRVRPFPYVSSKRTGGRIPTNPRGR